MFFYVILILYKYLILFLFYQIKYSNYKKTSPPCIMFITSSDNSFSFLSTHVCISPLEMAGVLGTETFGRYSKEISYINLRITRVYLRKLEQGPRKRS